MSGKSSKNRVATKLQPAAGRTADAELSSKVRELLKSLDITGTRFAQLLSVSRTQVSVWSNGLEQPNKEKLLKMAEMALTVEEKLWFLKKAGIDERVRALLRQIDQDAIVKPSLDSAFKIWFVKDILRSQSGDLYPDREGEMLLPAAMRYVGSDAFCMKVPEKEGINWVLSAGDYVVIEWAPVDLDALENSLVAVRFDSTPNTYEIGEEIQAYVRSSHERRIEIESFDEDEPFTAEEEKKLHEDAQRIQDQMKLPKIKFGWLRIQRAGGGRDFKWSKDPSRIVLETSPSRSGVGGELYPLSEWIVGIGYISPNIGARIKPEVRVVGRVVGWFKDRSGNVPREPTG